MGWITTFYMEHNWLLTMFAEELQDEIFGAQPFVLAPGSVNPSGRAIPTGDGTYTLSGHWTFGTGICHADWVLVSGKIEGDAMDAARNFLLPVDEVEVKDTWHVDGMAATGSRDIVVTDIVVPERRVSLMPPPHVFAKPGDPYLHRIPIAPFLSLTAAMPAMGAAKRALALFEDRLFDRVMFGTKRTQSARVPTQVRLANLRVEVDFAETLLRDVADRMQAPRRRSHRSRPARPAAPPPRHRAHRPPVPRRRARDHAVERRVGALPRQRAPAHPPRRPHDVRAHGLRHRPGRRRRRPPDRRVEGTARRDLGAPAASAVARLAIRRALGRIGLTREAERPLAEDVPLDLVGSTAIDCAGTETRISARMPPRGCVGSVPASIALAPPIMAWTRAAWRAT